MIKPMTRTVHRKPMRGMSCWKTAGNITPPRLEPHNTNEMATARRFTKYVDTRLTVGHQTKLMPIPPHKPCDRKICQYFVLMEVMKMARTSRNMPVMTVDRKYPASNKRPETLENRLRRKIWTDTIHEMVEGGRLYSLS